MTLEHQDRLHPSHVTRMSDSSIFDEICINCGNADSTSTWGRLAYPCPNEPDQHRVARMIGASDEFVRSTIGKDLT